MGYRRYVVPSGSVYSPTNLVLTTSPSPRRLQLQRPFPRTIPSLPSLSEPSRRLNFRTNSWVHNLFLQLQSDPRWEVHGLLLVAATGVGADYALKAPPKFLL